MPTFETLRRHLHRGGNHGYYWTVDEAKTYTNKHTGQQEPQKLTTWFSTQRPVTLNASPTQHVYFGVHPARAIPSERTRRDGTTYQPKAAYVRPLAHEIAAINCLLAEWDAKDFADGKAGALTHIEALPVRPSVLIDSGGGYHGYWLLAEPYMLDTTSDLHRAKTTQARWVSFVQSDEIVKDLARVFRVPGFANVKPRYAPDYPVVDFVWCEMDRLYTLDTLEAAIPAHIRAPADTPRVPFSATPGDHSAYVQAAYTNELDAVRSAPQGQRHYTLRDAAIKLGSLVWTNCISEQEIVDGLYDAVAPMAENKSNAYHTILDGVRYGVNRPRTIPERQPREQDKRMLTNITPNDVARPVATSAPDAPRFRNWLHETEIDTHIHPPTWLVKDILAMGEVTIFYGPGDAGKSTLVTDLMCRIAQHYKIVYVAAEDASGVKVKRAAWMEHYRRGTNGNFYVYPNVLDLDDAVQVSTFINEMQDIGPHAIVVDTLSQCSGMADENSSDMKIVMASLQRIAHTTGAATIPLHHSTKDGSNYRGYSGIKNNTYGFLEVTKDSDDRVTLSYIRIKNSRPWKPRHFRFVAVETKYRDEDGMPIESVVLKPAKDVLPSDKLNSQQVKLLQLISDMQAVGKARSSDLQRATEMPTSTFYRMMRHLIDGKAYVKKEEERGAVTYYITDAGRVALAAESSDPTYQADGIHNSEMEAVFEVNTRLGSSVFGTTVTDSGLTATTTTYSQTTTKAVGSSGSANGSTYEALLPAYSHIAGYDEPQQDAVYGDYSHDSHTTPTVDGSSGTTTTTTLSPYKGESGSSSAGVPTETPERTEEKTSVTITPLTAADLKVATHSSGYAVVYRPTNSTITTAPTSHEANEVIADLVQASAAYRAAPTTTREQQMYTQVAVWCADPVGEPPYRQAKAIGDPVLRLYALRLIVAARVRLPA